MDRYRKHILVVGDDGDCRRRLAAWLKEGGCAVRTACDGVSGLNEMRARRVDLLITDGHMSGFIGHEFAGFCRAAWPEVPIILLSGDPEAPTACVDDAGPAACLNMPYEVVMLLRLWRTAR